MTVVTRLGGEHFAALLALQDSCFDGALLLSRMLLHDVLDQRDARGERLGAQAAGVHPGLLLLVGVAVPAGHVLGEMVPPVAPVAADVAYEQGLLVVGRSVLLEALLRLEGLVALGAGEGSRVRVDLDVFSELGRSHRCFPADLALVLAFLLVGHLVDGEAGAAAQYLAALVARVHVVGVGFHVGLVTGIVRRDLAADTTSVTHFWRVSFPEKQTVSFSFRL